MIGNNTVIINKATMNVAIAYYFKSILRIDVSVIEVKANNDMGFEVSISSVEDQVA